MDQFLEGLFWLVSAAPYPRSSVHRKLTSYAAGVSARSRIYKLQEPAWIRPDLPGLLKMLPEHSGIIPCYVQALLGQILLMSSGEIASTNHFLCFC